jgi:phosphopantetheinyl transferase
METFLEKNSKLYGFHYGVESITKVASSVEYLGKTFVSSALSEKEYAIFEKLEISKRECEWLSGRLAAKKACGNCDASLNGLARFSDISILSDEAHAPYIADYPALNVSISHSHEYAIAVVAPFDIGVDMEKIEPRPDSLAKFFCSREERSILENAPNQKDDLMTRFWSRKEAVSKFLKLGGKLNFDGIDTVSDVIEVSRVTIRLLSGRHEDYWISIAL